jgi:hypothetical protein
MTGWLWLGGGTFLVIAGLIVATLCAGFITSDNSPLSRREAVAGFLIFTVVATLGALMTTQGWDQRSDERQRTTLLGSLAIETLMNRWLLQQRNYTETNPERLRTFVHLPSLQRSVLTEFVTSSLFPPEKFMGLRVAALELHMQIDFLETVLTTVRDQMARATPDEGAALRARIPNAPQIKAVQDAMDRLAAAMDATGSSRIGRLHWSSSCLPTGNFRRTRTALCIGR